MVSDEIFANFRRVFTNESNSELEELKGMERYA